MDKLIATLSIDGGNCVHLLRASSDVDDLLKRAGFAEETADTVSVMEGASRVSSVSDDFADAQQYPWRKGRIARYGVTIKMAGQAHEILESQFVRLKEALFGNHEGEGP